MKFSTSFLIVTVKSNKNKTTKAKKKKDKNKLMKKKYVLKFNKISTKPNKHTNKTIVLHFNNHFPLDYFK